MHTNNVQRRFSLWEESWLCCLSSCLVLPFLLSTCQSVSGLSLSLILQLPPPTPLPFLLPTQLLPFPSSKRSSSSEAVFFHHLTNDVLDGDLIDIFCLSWEKLSTIHFRLKLEKHNSLVNDHTKTYFSFFVRHWYNHIFNIVYYKEVFCAVEHMAVKTFEIIQNNEKLNITIKQEIQWIWHRST